MEDFYQQCDTGVEICLWLALCEDVVWRNWAHFCQLNCKLKTCQYTSNGESLPHSLPAPLMNLKNLRLFNTRLSYQKHIAFNFCLLRSMPSLRTLNICLYQEFSNSEEAVEGLEAERMSAYNLNQLTTMDIEMIRVTSQRGCDFEPMFRLIQILLSSCPCL